MKKKNVVNVAISKVLARVLAGGGCGTRAQSTRVDGVGRALSFCVGVSSSGGGELSVCVRTGSGLRTSGARLGSRGTRLGVRGSGLVSRGGRLLREVTKLRGGLRRFSGSLGIIGGRGGGKTGIGGGIRGTWVCGE